VTQSRPRLIFVSGQNLKSIQNFKIHNILKLLHKHSLTALGNGDQGMTAIADEGSEYFFEILKKKHLTAIAYDG
jgi:hypothetical protein